jgi:biotin operon repressor
MTSISAISSTTSTTATTAVKRKHQDPLEKLAATLGLSKDDLKTQLKSGKSLDDVATAQGVSHDDLIAAIKAGMPSKGTSSTSGADSAEMAEKIASTKGLPTPPPGGPGGPGGPKGMNSGMQDSSKLAGISKLLDTDSSTVSSATSATDLVKMLKDKGVDLSSLKNVLDSGDLVDVSA